MISLSHKGRKFRVATLIEPKRVLWLLFQQLTLVKRELISQNQTPPLLVFNHDKNTLNNLSATDYFSNCIS